MTDNTAASTMKTRDNVFDILKCTAIFLVVWGHALQCLRSVYYADQPVYRVIYSFHMPLFMAIVGYFSYSLRKLDFKEVVMKKGRQLILPAVTFGSLFFLNRALKSEYAGGLYSMIYCLWFLKSAFFCCLIYCLGAKLIKPMFPCIAITLIISQLASTYQINLMYPCFIAGIILRAHSTAWLGNIKIVTIFSGIVFLILLCFWDAGFWDIPSLSQLQISSENSLWFDYIFKTGFKIMIGISGAVFFISLFKAIFRNSDRPITRRMSEIGKHTLGIYIFQTFILEIYLSKLLNFDNYDIWLFSFVITPIISAAVFGICLLLTVALKRNRFLAFILFGSTVSSGISSENETCNTQIRESVK